MFLFLDSTKDLTLGLLNKDYQFIEYEFIQAKKTSLILQHKIYDLLQKNKMALSELEGVIYMAGPGSYTGMRVAQGFVDICHWQGLKVYSTYHHQIPFLTGMKNYTYLDHAFKNEVFVAEFEDGASKTSLVANKDFRTPKGQLFSNHANEFEQSESTKDLIRDRGEMIFSSMVRENMNSKLYYYRSLEQEFKVANG